MSKYYKAEDITELISACEWRMTLAKERHGEGFVDYSKQVLDVDELTKRLSKLPTIEIPTDDAINKVLDAPSVVPTGRKTRQVERAEGEWVEVVKRTEQYDKEGRKSWAVIYQCPNCGFVLNAIENHILQYNYCPECGSKMKGADDE